MNLTKNFMRKIGKVNSLEKTLQRLLTMVVSVTILPMKFVFNDLFFYNLTFVPSFHYFLSAFFQNIKQRIRVKHQEERAEIVSY